MNRRYLAFVATLVCGLLTTVQGLAQDFSPVSLAAQSFSISILSGSPPFPASGNYMLFTSPMGSNFVVLGEAESNLSWGTYSYLETGTNTAQATLVDAQSGLNVSISLLYNSAAGGQLTFSNTGSASSQTASFTSGNYTTVPVPQLFGPSLSNGVFNAGVSGQAGGMYTVQTSTDLMNWSDSTTLDLSNMTAAYVDTNAGVVSKFYRAIPDSVDFAPGSIGGLSLNFTIAQGAAPMATNGFFQFMPDTSDAGYDEIAGPVRTNLPGGTYVYSKFAPGAASITSVDTDNVTNNFSLFFTSSTTGFFFATNPAASGFESGTFTVSPWPTLFLGSYRFTPDNSRTVSLDFAADGNPATLSVTDAASNVWTLTLPADALFDLQTITMTPTASVDSSGAVLPSVAAVLLTPDGTQFSDGVTLTVTTPTSLGPQASLMNAELDGSGLEIALSTNQGNSYSMTLYHFSSAALSNPSGQQLQNLGTVDSLEEDFEEDAEAAEAMNSSASSRVLLPPPPDETFCDTAKTISDANAYIPDVVGADFELITELLSTAQALKMLGQSNYPPQAVSLVVQIFTNDIMPKTISVINTYGSDPAKIGVVTIFANQILHQSELFEVAPTPRFVAAIQALPGLLNKAGTNYLNQLQSNHDYSAVAAVSAIAKDIQLLGGDNGYSANLIQSLKQDLNFQLTMDITTTTETPAQNGVPGGSSSDEAMGQFQITTNASPSLNGTGQINYVSGIEQGAGLTDTLVSGQSFTETSTLKLTDCPSVAAPTATLTFTPFGSLHEMWINSLGNTITANNLDGQSSYVFQNYQTTNGFATYGFSFTVPLQNGNAEAVNTTISQSTNLGYSTLTATLVLTLQHTPPK
jgi:hypothetical protein